ncbi:hypothetical protein [Phytomonospora endophytica]|uniref:Uncharacterized protein n=1 Tax=Phytomonospora endophytica TaxID=714109 RepID=A0A841G1K1_9ACTN|nr:hypothetical protein [Phytomonospora endophytica]MBB6038040.1 hypothetical protein [Phytomonospora endophytica]GIG67496.1 hypothetical protein Pen01_37910 [Phytomonospora endophytica]
MPAAHPSIRWVAHPLTIAAALVLLLNDHVLKAAFPGPITGKLSDVTGLAAAPALLALAMSLIAPRRLDAHAPAVAALITSGLAFTLVKTTQTGADIASALWSALAGPSLVRADATDLVALPALALAWLAWRRSRPATQIPVAATTVGRARLLLGLPLLLLATTATSLVPMDAVYAVEEEDGRVAVYTTYGVTRGQPGTWSRIETPSTGDTDPIDAAEARMNRTDCVPEEPGHCYRLHEGEALGIDETLDDGATWHTTWEIPPERWPWLAERHGLGGDYSTELLTARDILVRTTPQGHEVIVAAGIEGLVVRSTDGTWTRVPVDTMGGEYGPSRFHAGPLALARFGYGVTTELGIAALLTALAMAVGTGALAMRERRGAREREWERERGWPPGRTGVDAGVGTHAGLRGWWAVSCGLLVLGVPVLGVGAFTESAAWAVGLTLTMLVVHGGFAGLALRGAGMPRKGKALVVAAGALVWVAFAGPYLGWSAGWPAGYAGATGLAGICVAGVGAGVGMGAWVIGRGGSCRA